MPRFFNTTRSSISFTTRSGGVGVVPPKKWAVVPVSEAASADLVRLVQQGYLVRKEDAVEATPVASPKPAPIAAIPSPVTVAPLVTDAITPVSLAEVVASVPPVSESADDTSSTRKKRKYSPPVIEEVPQELPVIEAAQTEPVEMLEPVES